MSLNGINIVFTGKMERTRPDMENFARSLDANVQNGVKSTTDWLVAGQRTGKTKISKAKKLGVRILSEDDFYAEVRDREDAAVRAPLLDREELESKCANLRWLSDLPADKSFGF